MWGVLLLFVLVLAVGGWIVFDLYQTKAPKASGGGSGSVDASNDENRF